MKRFNKIGGKNKVLNQNVTQFSLQFDDFAFDHSNVTVDIVNTFGSI